MRLTLLFLLLFVNHTFAKNLAKLDGVSVSLEEAEFKAKALGAGDFTNLPKESKELVLTKILQEKLIEREAKREKLDRAVDFEATVRSLLVMRYLTRNEKELEAEALELYNNSKKELEGKKTYTFSHILLKTEEEAKKMQAEIFAKKAYWKQEFKKLAKSSSLDTTSAQNNGFVGKVPETMLPAEIVAALSKMKKNLLYGPVQSPFGFHLIFVDEIEPIQIPTFAEVRQRLLSQILIKKTEEVGNKLQNGKQVKFEL